MSTNAFAIVLAASLLAPVSAYAQQPPRDTLRTFAETIKQDLKSVVAPETVSILSTFTAFALLAEPFDKSLTHSASCSSFLKASFDPWARVVGQEWVLGGSAFATYAIGRVFDRPQAAAIGKDLIEAQLLAGATTHALKYATQRTRPDGEEFSFPSGHAAGMLAAATVIDRHYGWKAAVPAYAAATLVSGARLQANSHYASDIIMGAAVGILAGRAATFELGPHRVRLAPAVTANGVAITGSIH